MPPTLHLTKRKGNFSKRLSLDFHIYAHWEPHTLRNNKQARRCATIIPESIRFSPKRNDCSPRHHQESNPRPFRKLRAETLKSQVNFLVSTSRFIYPTQSRYRNHQTCADWLKGVDENKN
ncbi:hypothetical protein CEXT_174781 [Caerostris extrusa]|uniref:Uncharacterized protein n=1 Tax=Caerostris extrusa TaxID=172846 RepID=A0AAV4XGV6_CAEEX|nr:hypothetical protein CEXT_174781 [Caerostris extrusa]